MNFGLKSVLVGAFALACTVAAGTFTLTRVSAQDELNALKLQIENSRSTPTPEVSPTVGAAPSGSSPDASKAGDLTARISSLEDEKKLLVEQLAKISVDALSPESELGGLLNQLNSKDESQRRAAAHGLFELSDAQAAHALGEYYWRNRDEATRGILASNYMNFIWANDKAEGMAFVLKVLQADDPQHAGWAYEKLREEIYKLEGSKESSARDRLLSELRDVALRSKDTLVRTRAKLLLRIPEDLAISLKNAERSSK